MILSLIVSVASFAFAAVCGAYALGSVVEASQK